MRVRDFMKTNMVTVDINTPVMESLETMRANNIKRLPIVKNGKFVGNNLRRPQRFAAGHKKTAPTPRHAYHRCPDHQARRHG